MAFKAILLCVSALLVQSISANCCKRYNVPSCGCSSGKDYVSISSSGGDFQVTSIGPISPSGIAVASDLSLGGDLNLCGTLPYLSAVAFQDCFDTKGSASVSYGCGDCNNVGIKNVVGGGSKGLSNIGGCGCNY